MEEKNRNKIAKEYSSAIGFSVLCVSCLLLEIFTGSAGELWVLVVIWAIFGF